MTMTPLADTHTAEPLVSVITIFLDEERFLAEAIESVVAQTYSNWELLLCDDGSTDASAAIAAEWCERYPDRIRCLTHPGRENRGMSATRNLGLAHCRGEYVAFLDGDDVWLREKLERQVAVLRTTPRASAAVTRTLYWHGWTGRDEDVDLDRFSPLVGPANRLVQGAAILRRILRGSVDAICTCSVLIRRDAVMGVGGFEARFRGLFEDQVFFSKLLTDHEVFVMDECLDLYRQHPESCCAVATLDMSGVLAKRTEFLRWLRGWVREHGAPASLRWRIDVELRLHRHPRLVEGRRRARDGFRYTAGCLVGRSFSVARRLLPAALRESLWQRFGGQRREERRLAAASRAAGEDAGHPHQATRS